MNKKEAKPLSIQKKTGILSSAITLVVVLCLVLVNLIATVVTEKYPVKIDLTSNQAFRITQQSIDYLAELDKDVSITVLNTKNNFVQGNQYFDQAIAVIEQYAQYSSHIKVEYVDLMARPTFTAQYPELNLQINDILVVCGENQEKLTAYDVFNVETSWTGSRIISSKAEQAMTGALMRVTDDDKVKVAILTGHEEGDSSALQMLLQKNGYEISSAMLLTEGVPPDTKVAVLTAPLRDITEEEAASLDAFLENNGEYGKYLVYFASTQQGDLPILQKWLAKWGIQIGEGAVLETDPNRVANSIPYFGIVDIVDTALTGKMPTIEIPVSIPFSRPVNFTFSSAMGYTTKPLLTYSETAGIAPPDVQDLSDVRQTGPIPVAGMTTLEKDGKQSSLLVFGSELSVDSGLLSSGALSNADYFLSAFNTLCEKENALFIAPKELGGGIATFTQGQALLYAAIFLVLLPLVILVIGIAIWLRRKYR